MAMARYLVLVAALIAVASVGRGQGHERSSVQSLNTRTVSVYTGLGFLELLALGVQYQINDEFALGVKADVALVAGHDLPQGGSGGGLKGSYFFSRTGEGSFLSMNVVNVETSYLATSGGVPCHWKPQLVMSLLKVGELDSYG
jgi:hypothetical protein